MARSIELETIATTILAFAILGSAPLLYAEDEHPGKELFVKEKCNSCHAVASQGIEATRGEDKAPDLSDAAALLSSAEWAKAYILREEEKDGKKHRRPFRGDEKDLEKIVDWMLTLKSS